MQKAEIVLGAVLVVCVTWAATVSAEEVPKTFEETHSDKAVFVLLDSQDIKVNSDWSYVNRIHNIVRIQKEDAKDMGEIPIEYDKELIRITDLKAFTVAPDGKRFPFTKSQDMAVYSGEPMYSNTMQKVLSMPMVGVGAVIDLSYTEMVKAKPIKNAFWCVQSLRQNAPVKELRFSITFPKKLNIHYREFGLTKKPEVEEKNGWVTYRWVLKDIYDDSREEAYAPPPSPEDPMEAFEFSSIPSWEEFARWYSGLIDKNTRMTPEIKAEAKKVAGDKELVHDKVRAILEYIQDNFRYVSMSFGENAFEPHPTDEVFRNKYGDCKDLSLLARAMLKAVGVKAHLALFNTEDSINDPSFDLPIPVLFDHVLLLVEDPLAGDFYADPLLKGYDIGQYPMNFQRAYTFVIDNGKGRFGRLPEFDAERTAERTNILVDINEDWSGVFEISKVWDLDASIRVRDALKSMNEDQKKEFYEKIDFSFAQGGEFLERKYEGLSQRYGRMRSTIRFRRPDEFPSSDGLVVVDLDAMEREETFEKKERQKPFFFRVNGVYESEEIYRIPPRFEVLHIPQDIKLEGPYMSGSRTFKRTPLGVKVNTSIRVKRTKLDKGALKDLQAFHSELSRQSRQRIVFRRVKK